MVRHQRNARRTASRCVGVVPARMGVVYGRVHRAGQTGNSSLTLQPVGRVVIVHELPVTRDAQTQCDELDFEPTVLVPHDMTDDELLAALDKYLQ